MSLITRTPEIGLSAAPGIEVRRQATDVVDLIALGLALLVLVIASVSIAYLFVLAVNWYNTPFLGALITDTLAVNGNAHPLTSADWNGFQAGLRDGDQIVSIKAQNGQTLNFDPNATDIGQQLNTFLASLSHGQIVQVEIQR